MAQSEVNKLSADLKVVQKLSGDVTTAAAVPVDVDGGSGWFDMGIFSSVLAVVNLVVLGGSGIEAFSVVADAKSDGSGGNVTIATHATPTTADAAGDMLKLEVSAEQLAQEGADNSKSLRYIAVKLETHNASDNVLVTLIGAAKYAADGNTADIVAA